MQYLKSDDRDNVIEGNSDNIIHLHDNLHIKSVKPGVIRNRILEVSDIKRIHKGFENEYKKASPCRGDAFNGSD